MRPRAIGRFDIEAEAGSGTAGTVYQALDRTSGVRVAVKVLHGLSPTEMARFSREARQLARVRHPGVVRYVGHGTTDEGNAYLVMEWLDGEDLRRRLSRDVLSLDESLVLGRRVAEALAAVHAQGIVHRDVKPANIFLPAGMVSEAKIVDFGLVRGEGTSLEVTKTGMVVGTPSYMSPEQARGQRAIDGRADVFALGCVLYKCLTGRAPFEGSSVLAVLTKVLLEDPPPPRALRSEVPSALDDLVHRMMAKQPDDRPESAAAVAAALAAIPSGGARTRETGRPASSATPSPGLTTAEQHVGSVLLVGFDPDEPPPSEQTLPSAKKSTLSVDLGEIVERHGGEIEPPREGMRVVTFGTRALATDQAARAARCALALRAALPRAAMAIATGRLDDGGHDGDVITRAAALLARPSAGGPPAVRGGLRLPPGPPINGGLRPPQGPPIRLDDLTAALLGARFEVSGAEAPQLLGASADAAAPTLLGRATPMVGRDWELGSIRSLFTSCVEDHEPRTMLVTGAAGMGKSRLAREAIAMVRNLAPGVQVWQAQGDPLRAGSGLGVIGQLVRSSGVPSAMDPWVAEILAEVAGDGAPDEASPALRAARQDARVMNDQVRAAWDALVDRAASEAPLLLVIEDAQWADAASLRLLGGALHAVEHRPWMVLVLARPELHEAFPRLWEGHAPQEIRLGPLHRRASERLVRAVLEDAGADTVERLVAQADGNAFYLEELIRAVAAGAPRGALPDTVLAMVDARLSALPPDTRRVLRAASVFGEVFWSGGVEALLGGTAPPANWIEDLVRDELLLVRPRSRFAGERELSFRHALLREGAYAALTEKDRALGHALAGAWLEARGETDAMVLARHFEAAGDEARAARSYLAAAVQALRAADVEAAVACAEKALARAADELDRIACLGVLCEAHAWRDDSVQVIRYADEVSRLAAPGAAPWIQAMSWKQSAALILGRVDELVPAVMALTSVEGAPGTGAVLATALAVTAFVLAVGGQTAMVAGVVAKMEAVLAREGPDDPAIRAPVELARVWAQAWGPGDAWAALGHARAALAGAEEVRDARYTRFVHIFLAMCLWQLGLFEEADAALPAQSAGANDLTGVVSALYRGIFLADRGDPEDLAELAALAARRLDLARLDPAGTTMRTGEGRWILGEAAVRSGDLEAAERELAAGLDALLPSVVAWQVAAARLVSVRVRAGRVEEAIALDRELQASFAATGHGLRGTLVRLVHAEALAAAGDTEAARAAIREAHEDLAARAARIEDPEVRRRFLADVPENARVFALAGEWEQHVPS